MRILKFFFLIAFLNNAFAQKLTVVTFYLNSNDTDTNLLGERIAQLDETLNGVDIWGFSNVRKAEVLRYIGAHIRKEAKEGSYQYIMGRSGGRQHLGIIFNTDNLSLVQSYELTHMNIESRVRAPLVGEFIHGDTGVHFLVVVNHLYVNQSKGRHRQAEMLNMWANNRPFPIIAIGDFHFEWELDGETRDAGFDLLTKGDVFTWVRPELLVPTQCNSNSIQDFVFAAGTAKTWKSQSQIQFSESTYCPDDDESAHRPIVATFEVQAN